MGEQHCSRANGGAKDHRIIGTVLALALGDAFGAPYELRKI
jgi:ADP-ribosylglycohydrolase